MQFLIVTKTQGVPPQLIPSLAEAMKQWMSVHRASGKMESVWALAGQTGGAGVLNVESHQELDDIMAGFPFLPWTDVQVTALADMERSLTTRAEVAKRALAAAQASA